MEFVVGLEFVATAYMLGSDTKVIFGDLVIFGN